MTIILSDAIYTDPRSTHTHDLMFTKFNDHKVDFNDNVKPSQNKSLVKMKIKTKPNISFNVEIINLCIFLIHIPS